MSKLSLEKFIELKSDFPCYAIGSQSAKDPSWENRHPGILLLKKNIAYFITLPT